MDGNTVTNFVSLLTQGLLIITLPIVIAAAFQYIRKTSVDLKSKVSQEQWGVIQRGVELAVRAAEQVGLSGQLNSGSEKRQYAISAVQDYLSRVNIPIEVDEIVTLIEAEVNSQFSSYAPPIDTAETRSALLDKAVETAVLAAEQTGAKELAIETATNFAVAKKTFAVDLATKYLGEHGIKVDTSLIDGMIEAQIMRLKLQALQWKVGK